jgi:hypothetical protein
MTAATSGYSVTNRSLATDAGVNSSLVAQARTVAEHAPDLTALVISGAKPLKDAYDSARQRRDAANGEQAQLAALPDDLAVQVREESLTLNEAKAAANARADEQRRDREAGKRALDSIVTDLQVAVGAIIGGLEADAEYGITDDIIDKLSDAVSLLAERGTA